LKKPPELDSDRVFAQSSIESLLAGQDLGNITCTSTVERGPLWQVLAALIEEKDIDLIVLGTHGRHGLKKLLLGSVAEQIFRLAPVPVLTVGPHVTNEGIANSRFGTILFATDFSVSARSALPYALLLARANGSHLILLHAVTANVAVVPDTFDDIEPATVKFCKGFIADAFAHARQQLEELVPAETARELNPENIAEYGPPAETILKVAKEKHADLIVMGARRAPVSSMVTHMPWKTASDVVCGAHCPVLTVRN
jgi:nucleotide-binding universal stress UspA family protein